MTCTSEAELKAAKFHIGPNLGFSLFEFFTSRKILTLVAMTSSIVSLKKYTVLVTYQTYSFYSCTEPAPIVHEADVVTSDNSACSKVGQGVLQEVSWQFS